LYGLLDRLDLVAAPLGLGDERVSDQQAATQLLARDVEVERAALEIIVAFRTLSCFEERGRR